MIIVIHENKEWMPPFEEAFLADNDIGIASIEIIIDEDGVVWTYDINTNTNYNSAAEEQAKESAPLKIAEYLYSLQS